MGRYSETLMEHFNSPRNGGVLEHPDRVGIVGVPGQGPFFVLYLKLDGDRVREARYRTYGCGPTIAAGSVLTELIAGRTIEECRGLTTEDVIAALDGVPPEKLHCPTMAVAALHKAVEADET
jgi:nitrogen fixation NifU-like protein